MMYLVNSNKRKGELERIDYKLYDCSCPNCIRQKPCNEFFPLPFDEAFSFLFLPPSIWRKDDVARVLTPILHINVSESAIDSIPNFPHFYFSNQILLSIY